MNLIILKYMINIQIRGKFVSNAESSLDKYQFSGFWLSGLLLVPCTDTSGDAGFSMFYHMIYISRYVNITYMYGTFVLFLNILGGTVVNLLSLKSLKSKQTKK